MDESTRLDERFRQAVSLIDAGDLQNLERLLAENRRLACERLRSPGAWLREAVGSAVDGFFRDPYLLWFVAEDPVRNGRLPANIGAVVRTIVDAARGTCAENLQEQLDYALQLVSWSWIARESGVQIELLDVLMDAGASPGGAPANALVNGNVAAAEHLVKRGAPLTLATALCLERWQAADSLAESAAPREKQLALTLAALRGHTGAPRHILRMGVDVNAVSPDLYSHATPLHHAVHSGSLEAGQDARRGRGRSAREGQRVWRYTARLGRVLARKAGVRRDRQVSSSARMTMGTDIRAPRVTARSQEKTVMSTVLEQAQEFWNRVADDWQIQVGTDGDANRRLNSDPVLWAFAGDVRGLRVLDAGCGTGYLSIKLAARGASVTGIDFSERMIAIARAADPTIDFRMDSMSELSSIADADVDLVVSNYVLMDTPDLEGAMRAVYRVLKPAGIAVLVFSHPCFPAGCATMSAGSNGVTYVWNFPYFGRRRCVDPPWAHFTSEFIWFHRPLSDYWKAFTAAGFAVVDFDEPRLTPERYQLAGTAAALEKNQARPYSVAFKLRKTAA